MALETNNYQLLIKKLDQFIRKYYVNQLIRGVLYSIALVLALFIAITVAEYFMYFPTGTRKVLWYSFLGISGIALLGWVLLPLSRYLRLGKVISHERAADIIGDHFTEVKDKLLNILQLKKQSGDSTNAALINASIDQKIGDLKPVPFKSAINLNQNRKYLKYALPPLMLLLILLFAAPNLIKSGTERLIKNNETFERPAPFTFEVENDDMTVVQYEDYDIDVRVRPTETGAIPNEVFIDVDNYQYKLIPDEKDRTHFTYTFRKISKDTKFKLFSGQFESKDYDIEVLKKPNIVGFDIKLDYPSYTKRKDEMIANIGDVVVPVGTRMRWNFTSQNTDEVGMKFSREKKILQTERAGSQSFTLKRRARKDETYMVYVSNQYLKNADSVGYSIAVTPDLYPTINVERFEDSTDNKMIFFVGDASDDYGLRSLTFNYTLTPGDRKTPARTESETLQTNPGTETQYDYTWDLLPMELKPGDELTYFFEVLDNDGVNGSKSARTNVMSYAMPTVEEFEEQEEKNNDEIKKDLAETLEEAQKLREDIDEMKNKMLQKKELNWQDKKEIEKMLERQKDMQQQMENAQKNFDENLKNQEQFEETKESILEKQEKLQQLFDELMSEEMKEMMKKMEEMLDELTQEDALEQLEEMEMTDEELEKELDRMLELFKEMELEHQLEQTAEKLEELAEKEEELSEESKEGKKSADELKKEQEKLNEEFEKIKEDMEKLQEMNEELESPKHLDDMDEQSEDIEKDMQDSSDELQKGEKQKAGEKQKSASEKMKEMAQGMKDMMQQANQEQMEEDLESLRQLLENLVTLSFDQEETMNDIGEAQINTPHYVGLVQKQYKIKDDFKVVEDSLQALSKRVFEIESFVTEKVTEVKRNIKESLEQLEERKTTNATTQQQYSMTGMNDLALMLSEVMNQMQQQMAQQQSGDQMCENPGNKPGGKGKPSLSGMQQQLKDQMSEMQKMMKDGQKPGGKGGKGQMSKEFAEMAAKQAAIRKELKKMNDQNKQQGKGSSGELEKLMEEMDKTETDLVNKRLTNEMLKRQQEILTRLLEAENAQRQREFEKRRESKTAQEQERKMPPELEEYIKKREAEIEMYKSVSPALKPYYKTLVEEYFDSLKKNK